MTNGGGKPKPVFFVVAGLVVLALVSLAVWRCQGKTAEGGAEVAGKSGKEKGPEIDINKVKQEAQGDLVVEKADNLTAKEFKELPAVRLPEVTGVSSYQDLGATRKVR